MVCRQRVLLVEDSRMYTVAISDRLEKQLDVDVVHCASLHLLKLELSKPDNEFSLAILDLNQSDGVDGAALDFVLDHGLRTIVFTATDSVDLRRNLIARNVVDYIAKTSSSALNQLIEAAGRQIELCKPHVLIVDDNAALRKRLANLVSAGNFLPVFADTPDDALKVLDKHRTTELVLIRADRPDERPADFLRDAKTRFGEGSVRVIGYSRTANSGNAARFLASGGDDFVHWAGNDDEVLVRMSHTLEMHNQIRLLTRMASRDFLTDLFNRRYFFDQGPKLVDMCLRQQNPVSAAIVDIDHFKRLNDTYGHEIGDVVLKAVAKRLRALVGEQHHLIARLGGEEFGIIYSSLDIKQACEFSDRVREDISKVRIVVEEEELSVTISMGLADIGASETFDNYLNAADQYLYMAKHSGRNRVFSDYHVAQSHLT